MKAQLSLTRWAWAMLWVTIRIVYRPFILPEWFLRSSCPSCGKSIGASRCWPLVRFEGHVEFAESCSKCGADMKVRHRIDSRFDVNVRVLWECGSCIHSEWRQYGFGLAREKKGRLH